jgi:hypothetical protein
MASILTQELHPLLTCRWRQMLRFKHSLDDMSAVNAHALHIGLAYAAPLTDRILGVRRDGLQFQPIALSRRLAVSQCAN